MVSIGGKGGGGLDQYGAEPFEQQQFGTACVKGVKRRPTHINNSCIIVINIASDYVANSGVFVSLH